MSEPTTSVPNDVVHASAPPAVGADPVAASPVVPDEAQSGSTTPFRIVAVVVIVVIAALVAWLALRDNGNSSADPTNARAVTSAQINEVATSVGHPVFWLGPRTGMTYELVQTSSGTIVVRYLPAGVAVGAKEPYLSVATYPFQGAYPAIQTVTQQPNIRTIKLPNGGLAETSKGVSTNVHAAYPGVDYQAEIFDPTPGNAAKFVRAGKLTAFGSLNSTASAAPQPKAATAAALRTLAATLSHPLYWAGPKAGVTYEVVQTSDGQVSIRYLPKGTKVGAAGQYLTVGTYPYPGAFAAIKTLTKDPNQRVIKLSGGGLAVVDKTGPRKNIHLAYPGVDYQVEVFDPSAATANRIVSSDQVTSIG